MKILTTNFLTCAVKACKSSPQSYPLHFRDATLERTELDFNPLFIRNILPRVNWDALKVTATELGLSALVPDMNPVEFEDEDEEADETTANGKNQNDEDGEEEDIEKDDDDVDKMQVESSTQKQHQQVDQETLRKLHSLLLETAVVEGKLVCGNCGFEYPIKEGVGNFLLPAHLV